MIYNEIEFKSYNKNYSVSENGEVYSHRTNKLMKHYIDHDGYHRVDIDGQHLKVHKLVFLVWGNTPIGAGQVVRHVDDNKDNNHISNLCLGTQRQNIHDCARNGHRCGHIKSVTVFDKDEHRVLKFPTVSDLIMYTGHSNLNGSFAKIKNKQWFTKRFDVISVENVETRERLNQLRSDYEASIVGLS